MGCGETFEPKVFFLIGPKPGNRLAKPEKLHIQPRSEEKTPGAELYSALTGLLQIFLHGFVDDYSEDLHL
jgi:hypothetical protein